MVSSKSKVKSKPPRHVEETEGPKARSTSMVQLWLEGIATAVLLLSERKTARAPQLHELE